MFQKLYVWPFFSIKNGVGVLEKESRVVYRSWFCTTAFPVINFQKFNFNCFFFLFCYSGTSLIFMVYLEVPNSFGPLISFMRPLFFSSSFCFRDYKCIITSIGHGLFFVGGGVLKGKGERGVGGMACEIWVSNQCASSCKWMVPSSNYLSWLGGFVFF